MGFAIIVVIVFSPISLPFLRLGRTVERNSSKKIRSNEKILLL